MVEQKRCLSPQPPSSSSRPKSPPPPQPSFYRKKTNSASVASLRVIHQISELKFSLKDQQQWDEAEGITHLFLIGDREMALCFRGGGIVKKVEVCGIDLEVDEERLKEDGDGDDGGGGGGNGIDDDEEGEVEEGEEEEEEEKFETEEKEGESSTGVEPLEDSPFAVKLKNVPVQYQHFDPLEKVLLRPPNTIKQSKCGFEADSQCHRGGGGITLAMRAASVASSLGELRLTLLQKRVMPVIPTKWKKRLLSQVKRCWKDALPTNHNSSSNNNNAKFEKRMEYVSKQLSSRKQTLLSAFKISIHFSIPSCTTTTGGLHFHPDHPVIYTTSGTIGDPYSGPRTWIPCADSASIRHRSSHSFIVQVTAPTRQGLTIVGAGEDYGISSTRIHPDDPDLATQTWTTLATAPIPIRSLGFAIGPFTILPDPEYPSTSAAGIRQVVLAPVKHRPNLYDDDKSKAPHPQSKTVMKCTSGIPLRALSLVKELLALPSFPSSSYTQIFLPDAVHGGMSSGTMEQLVSCNPFLGGCIIDSQLLFPPEKKLPFYTGGRMLQLHQAKCAIAGWITSALPLSGEDDVGEGYLYTVFAAELLSIYERVYGGSGEGGGKPSFYNDGGLRVCGLNSPHLDFLPMENIEEDDIVVGAVGSVPLEEKNKDELWRGSANGTESRSSSLEEWSVRKYLLGDVVECLERGDREREKIPLPSVNWTGSHLSLSFLSSNACSSERVGCGGVDLLHPVGGVAYRWFKSELFARVTEGRAGLPNFLRVMRCCFFATLLHNEGKTTCLDDFPEKDEDGNTTPKPPFFLCLEEILKSGGISHSLLVRSLRLVSGPMREAYLRGSLVDVSHEITDSKGRHFVDPELYPNTYVRGASGLYMRVGVHVEPAGSGETSSGATAAAAAAAVKGIHLHVYVEPVIPEGGSAFGGPMTLRVVENEGQCREFLRNLDPNGGRCEWGPIFLHAKPVTSQKQQTAASGAIEGGGNAGGGGEGGAGKTSDAPTPKKLGMMGDGVFNTDILHGGGYQALELVRLTNRTPLLWIRVDPHHLYGGRIAIFQPDACLGEQLFHDGDAAGQLDAIRSLAERPLRIQGSVKITSVYDVSVNEMPVRVLGDCLRGSPALHSSLPHTPTVRVQAALAIAQWQNNKAPVSKDAVGIDSWLGLNLLLQYFKERYYVNDLIMPVKYIRPTAKKVTDLSANSKTTAAARNAAGSNGDYQYLDAIDKEERDVILEATEEIRFEEDEEYRVRSAVVTAIASIRAKDGQTPPLVLTFLEAILLSGDGAALPAAEDLPEKKRRVSVEEVTTTTSTTDDEDGYDLPYESCHLVADALLALCHVNCRPDAGEEQATMQLHPILPLMELCHRWLDWELYKEVTRMEMEAEIQTGVSGACYANVAACAITALCSLAILRQSTSPSSNVTEGKGTEEEEFDEEQPPTGEGGEGSDEAAKKKQSKLSDEAASAKFYIRIFDARPRRADVVRAAAAQAVTCICCAADRLESADSEPLGLLTALEFLLDRILEPTTSSPLRQTLSSLMLDACTGKVCSTHRIATLSHLDILSSATRFLTGPLGAAYGGDNGSALLTTVSESTYPAANAVNDGARLGLRLLMRSGRDANFSEATVVRVAVFATKLWRCMNGEDDLIGGVCRTDGILRIGLLSLWQWIWPKTCIAVLRVQSWRSLEGTQRYKDLGADKVMKITEEEKEASTQEENALGDLKQVVTAEIERQKWRGEMAIKAFEYWQRDGKKDPTGAMAQGLGHPLPVIQKDTAWKLGGWVASAAQQRRAKALDGGTAVTKVRLTVKNTGMEE